MTMLDHGQERFAGWPSRARALTEPPRWVLEVPVDVADSEGLRQIAVRLADAAARVPLISWGEATMAPEDDRSGKEMVFCDLLLERGQRCALLRSHTENHSPVRRGHGL